LPWAKSSSIVVITDEVVHLNQPASDQIMASTLRDEMATFTDAELLGSGAAVAGVRPAGLLNGITAVPSGATLADSLRRSPSHRDV
jgi:hypothetical protein